MNIRNAFVNVHSEDGFNPFTFPVHREEGESLAAFNLRLFAKIERLEKTVLTSTKVSSITIIYD